MDMLQDPWLRILRTSPSYLWAIRMYTVISCQYQLHPSPRQSLDGLCHPALIQFLNQYVCNSSQGNGLLFLQSPQLRVVPPCLRNTVQ